MGAGGVVLGVDVGGTGIKARVVDESRAGCSPSTVCRPHGTTPPRLGLAEVVADLTARSIDTVGPLDAVGVVVPGVVDERTGTAVLSVNLGWRGVPLRDRVHQALLVRGITIPVAFGHDVRAGALAEVSGSDDASRALRTGSVGFVPVGTGLASALVVDGTVVDGGGWAGEIGQVRITEGSHRAHGSRRSHRPVRSPGGPVSPRRATRSSWCTPVTRPPSGSGTSASTSSPVRSAG